MKKKYHYISDGFYVVVFCMFLGSVIVPMAVTNTESEFIQKYAVELFFTWLIISSVIGFILGRMPASFEADENSVTFHLLFQKKIYIPYSSILSIEVTREYDEPVTPRGRPQYVEYLRIDCEDIEYNFDAPMKIDMNETGNHPEKLQEQFEQGMFWCLKTYIESHM